MYRSLKNKGRFEEVRAKSCNHLAFLALFILLFACGKSPTSLPYYNTPDLTPIWLSEEEAADTELHTIAEFSFTDQDGNVVNSESFKGKIYVANFFFTSCPTVCPAMTSNLLRVQKAFENDNDVKLVSHIVMPRMDDSKRLKEYEESFGIMNGKWYLVTGNASEVYRLARQSYFAEEEPGYNLDSTQFLHTEHALLIDTKGHLRGVYNATLPLEITRLIEDIKILRHDSD